MRKNRKIAIKVALILLLLGPVLSWAEVKLRIYLQDGTLQAGNLVADNPDSFVVLTKEGRVEIKKDKIMFVNGKTLKQWEERPDKLFQTEIIPSEIPNPAYVNDKAPIPSLPAFKPVVEPVKPLSAAAQKSDPAKPVEAKQPVKPAATAAASSAATPVTPAAAAPATEPVRPTAAAATSVGAQTTSSSPASSSATARKSGSGATSGASSVAGSPASGSTPAAVAPASAGAMESAVKSAVAQTATATGGKRRDKRGKRAAPAETAQAPKAEEKQAVAAAGTKSKEHLIETEEKPSNVPSKTLTAAITTPASVAAIVPPKRFSRKEYGDYHYQRALKFEDEGEQGRALQELQLATVLDRQNADSIFMLGRLYKQQGLNSRAQKQFAHPLVRKRDEAKMWTDEINKADKEKKRSRQILIGSASVGALMWVPLLFAWRMFKKPPKRVFTAEMAEALQKESAELEEKTAAPEPEFAGFKPPAKQPEPAKSMSAPPVAPPPPPLAPPPAAIPPMPAAPAGIPPPISIPSTPLSRPPEPAVPLIPARVLEPPVPPPMPPPIIPPPVPEPLPVAQAPAAPPPNADGLDVQSVLRLASMIDRAVRNGNAYAIEEKFDMARREYRTAMALNPSCIEAYIGLGYASFAQGQWDLALEHYVKALGIDQNSADAHYGIGRVFLEIERVDEAIFEFQKTLALDPSFDDARETLTALGSTV